jgi:histidinol-phosphate aminotransferase
VLVDEAYFEYVDAPGYPDTSRWLNEFPNLVVTRTFSKAHALAGLRVGYALSNPEVADALNRVRQPFNVNSLGLIAAQASLGDTAHIARSVESNRAGMQQIKEAFAKLSVRVFPSAGNFLLVDCRRPAVQVYEGLLRAGVIVRPLGGYGMSTHQRITIGTAPQNERLIDALSGVLR